MTTMTDDLAELRDYIQDRDEYSLVSLWTALTRLARDNEYLWNRPRPRFPRSEAEQLVALAEWWTFEREGALIMQVLTGEPRVWLKEKGEQDFKMPHRSLPAAVLARLKGAW